MIKQFNKKLDKIDKKSLKEAKTKNLPKNARCVSQ
jgi:hypothetical protein